MSIGKFSDRFTALIDACVLAGALRRNLLLSLAAVGFYRPRWSARILDETEKAISNITNGQNDGSRPRKQIEMAFPEALVTGWEVFEETVTLPDSGDNHVLAAAIATSATVIVTDNLKDFPPLKLSPYAVEALSADEFIANTIDLDRPEAISALKSMRERLNNPPMNVAELIQKTEAQDLPKVATFMNKFEKLL